MKPPVIIMARDVASNNLEEFAGSFVMVCGHNVRKEMETMGAMMETMTAMGELMEVIVETTEAMEKTMAVMVGTMVTAV